MSSGGSNSWLITNTQLNFANQILRKDNTEKLNVYGLIDLSNLIQSIVLCDKLVILPGIKSNNVRDQLENNGLLTTLEIDNRSEFMFTSLKENWNSFDLLRFLNENHDPIADRIVDTLAVNKANVRDYIKDVEKFAKTYFDTPDWNYGGHLIRGNFRKVEDEFRYVNPNLSIYSETTVRKVYIGALLYFMVASQYGLNYSPDSVRLPLTAYFSKKINHSILKAAQALMNQFDDEINKDIERISAGYSNAYFEIQVPSVFTWIVKSCKDKSEVIEKAIELRDNENLKKYRKWINELNTAESLQKRNELIKRFQNKAEQKKKSKLDILKEYLPVVFGVASAAWGDILGALGAIGSGVIIAAKTLKNLWKNKNLVFLANLKKSLDGIISAKEQIKRLFGPLSYDDLEFCKKMNAYQDEYLPRLFSKTK